MCTRKGLAALHAHVGAVVCRIVALVDTTDHPHFDGAIGVAVRSGDCRGREETKRPIVGVLQQRLFRWSTHALARQSSQLKRRHRTLV